MLWARPVDVRCVFGLRKRSTCRFLQAGISLCRAFSPPLSSADPGLSETSRKSAGAPPAFADASDRNLCCLGERQEIEKGRSEGYWRCGEEVEEVSGARHVRVFWDTAPGNEAARRDPRGPVGCRSLSNCFPEAVGSSPLSFPQISGGLQFRYKASAQLFQVLRASSKFGQIFRPKRKGA